MRTNIDIDDALMQATMRATGTKTKKAAVIAAMRAAVRRAEGAEALEALRGIGWDGDLNEMRDDWTPESDWGLLDRR